MPKKMINLDQEPSRRSMFWRPIFLIAGSLVLAGILLAAYCLSHRSMISHPVILFCGFAAFGFLILAANYFVGYLPYIRSVRFCENRCAHCGYQLKEDGGCCTECGHRPATKK